MTIKAILLIGAIGIIIGLFKLALWLDERMKPK